MHIAGEARMTAFPRVEIDGLPITACSVNDVETILDDAVEGRTGPLRLATVNLNFLRLANENAELKEILLRSDFNFADGWPLLQMASIKGRELPERVTGSDLTPLICRWAAHHGWKLAFVGASERTRDILTRLIPARYGDIVVGHWTPEYRGRSLRDPELAAAIEREGAHIVLVALGCPRQEQWVWYNLNATGARAAMGIGGSLDFMAGVQHRAPRMLQALRMEWLYRAVGNPRRLGKRYAKDFLYYGRVLSRTIVEAIT
jgi:N-acetylglucosaminyldiphosphoundecaprenol N-acetyl-beta-D-mannosaminyltransferase